MAGQTTEIRRPGRRTGDSGTKEAILAAALESFPDRGYDATSVRAVAKQAEVDPGLIRQYFGSNKQFFTAAVVDRSELGDRVLDALDGPTDSVGERIVRAYLDLWESPGPGRSCRRCSVPPSPPRILRPCSSTPWSPASRAGQGEP